MVHRKYFTTIVLVQTHFIKLEINETYVTSQKFQQIGLYPFDMNASAGHWKRCGGHIWPAGRPLTAHPWPII